MPSVSRKQHNFMQRVVSDPDFAQEVGVPVSVAQEYLDADSAEGLYQDDTYTAESDPPSLQW